MKKKVLLLLAEGFEFYEASAFIDVLGWNFAVGDKSIKLVTCGKTKEVKSAFNQKIIVDMTLEQIEGKDFHALAIPGGFKGYGFYKDAYSAKFLEAVVRFRQEKKPIASVCVGALPLGKSGILENKRATTYNQENGIYQRELENYGAIMVDKPLVEDENLITSWDPATAIPVAFRLLELLTSTENMEKVKEAMGFSV